MRELYKRVCILEQKMGISTGELKHVTEELTIVHKPVGPVTFLVEEITPIQYAEVELTGNNLLEWWPFDDSVPDALPGSAGPKNLVTLRPSEDGRPARVRILWGYFTGPYSYSEFIGDNAPPDDPLVAPRDYELWIGESMDGAADYRAAEDIAHKYGRMGVKGEGAGVQQGKRMPAELRPGVSLYEMSFDRETTIVAGFWSRWDYGLPAVWHNAPGTVSLRMEYVTYDIPQRVKLGVLLGSGAPVIYVRRGTLPIPG